MATKVALVGIGKIARDQHLPAINAAKDWQLAATVSRSASVAGIEAFTELEAMLAARPDIGVVSLCQPPLPRFDAAAAAIRSGRHVMLEKPPGASVAECQTLERMARAAGVTVFATWHSREAAMVAPAKAWLVGKRLRRLAVVWKEDVRRWHPGQAWIWQPGGLGVFDPGINALSIVSEILPDPLRLAAAELSFPANCDTPIAASLRFSHPHGAAVSAEFDFRQQGEQTWTIDIETSEGSLQLADGGARLTIDGVPETQLPAAGAALDGEYPRLYARMARLIGNGAVDMDLSPMIHVADAFLLGRRVSVEPFIE